MPFKKGDKKPPGSGRAKGTVNKTTAFTADIITGLLLEYVQTGKMSKDFDALDPDKRIAIAERLMAYIIPKKQAVQGDIELYTKSRTIEDTLIHLAEENDK